MPAFILISGFFAKKSLEKIDVKKLLWRIGLPYIIFQIIYLILHNNLFDYKFEYTLLTPYWILWFLMSIFFWHILSHIFNQFKYGILLSFAVGMLSGLFEEFGRPLGLSRTLTYFPFFYLGIKMSKNHFIWFKKDIVKIASICFLVLLYILLKNVTFFNYQFLWSTLSYEGYGFNALTGLKNRFIQYIVALFMMVALFSLVPLKKTFVSSIGENTLYIFLMQGFLIKLLQFFYPEFLTEISLTKVLYFSSISLLFSLLFSVPLIRKITSPLIEPIKIFKK
jgi:fucose 4-O-acetylase-like acetyltransferase